MDNNTQNQETAAQEAQAQEAAIENPVKDQAEALAEIPDLEDDDVVSAPKVVPLIISLANAQQRKVFVKRLTGDQAIKLLRDASSAGKDQNAVPVMKLTRCIVNPKDHTKARYSQVSALHLITEGDANLLAELLRVIHLINPVIKNA